MSSEMLTILFAIIGVGVALGGLIATLGGFIQVSLRNFEARIDARINALIEAVAGLRERVVELHERMVKLEGFMEGLKSAITQGKPT